jgi:hypothetical protein
MRLDAEPIGSLLGKNVFHQVRQDRHRDGGDQNMIARRALNGGPTAAVKPPNGRGDAEGMFVRAAC